MPQITPNLWFDSNGLDAAELWQVFPTAAGELLSDPDPARAQRAMVAMLAMTKIDLAALSAAADEE